jgi:hypothetical protein
MPHADSSWFLQSKLMEFSFKDWRLKKKATLEFGHFTIIFGQFFANYIITFHKTEILTVNVSKFQLNQKLNHKLQMLLTSVFFNFGRKKNENLSFKNGHFSTISGHFFANYISIFHKIAIQTVILRCLVCPNINLIKSYDILLLKIFLFACLKMHHFRGKIPK